MERGLVSAVITTHNRKELLLKAVQSVLNQTYENIECIVVDDASTDGTKDLLVDLIQEKKIKYIYIAPEDSKGGNHARNIGISNSAGEYIAFLDDDDEWMPQKIEKQIEAIKNNADIGFVYCAINRVFIKNGVEYKSQRSNSGGKKEGDLSKEVLIHIITVTSTILVRRLILDKAGVFDESLKFWQEYEFCIRALQETRAKYVDEVLVKYRVFENDSQRLSNKIDGWENTVDSIREKHKKYYDTLTEDDEGLRKLYFCIDGINRAKRAKSIKHFIRYASIILTDRETRKMFIYKVQMKLK